MSENNSSTNSGKSSWAMLAVVGLVTAISVFALSMYGQRVPKTDVVTTQQMASAPSPERTAELKQTQRGIQINEKVPSLTARDINGQTISLTDGKTRVLLFANLTCPCVAAYNTRMKALHEKYAQKGIDIAYVFPDASDTLPKIRDLVAREEYPWRNIVDSEQDIMKLFDVEATVEAVLIDSDGVLRYHGRVDDNIYEPNDVQTHDLDNAINAMLAGKEIPPNQQKAISCRIPRI